MASSCLNPVCEALSSPAAADICLEQFRAAGKLANAAAAEHAPESFNRLRELLNKDFGIGIAKLSEDEITAYVKDAQTKEADSLNAHEYQDLLENIVKYAALKAHRHPHRRFALGVAFSAASAMAITATAVAASAGVMLVAAAPLGAVVGALAVGASSMGQAKRDKKRAAKYTPPPPAPPAATAASDTTPAATTAEPVSEATAEEAPAAAVAEEVTAAAEAPAAAVTAEVTPAAEAPVAVAEEVTPAAAEEVAPAAAAATDEAAAAPTVGLVFEDSAAKSDELVSAVVEVMPTADETVAAAAAPAKETPFSAVSHTPITATSTDAIPAPAEAVVSEDTAPAVAGDSLPLPELLRSASPERPGSDAAPSDSAHELPTPRVSLDVVKSADLPPLAIKKKSSPSKKLKKSLSKSYKNFKKAMSISSSSDIDAAADAAMARTDKDVNITTPSAAKPPKGFSFRRSFSKDSASDINGLDGLSVQTSEGSATIKKMKELLRRSFTISTPRSSIDGSNRGSRARPMF